MCVADLVETWEQVAEEVAAKLEQCGEYGRLCGVGERLAGQLARLAGAGPDLPGLLAAQTDLQELQPELALAAAAAARLQSAVVAGRAEPGGRSALVCCLVQELQQLTTRLSAVQVELADCVAARQEAELRRTGLEAELRVLERRVGGAGWVARKLSCPAPPVPLNSDQLARLTRELTELQNLGVIRDCSLFITHF